MLAGSRATRETICCAGGDIVLIETVGVGRSGGGYQGTDSAGLTLAGAGDSCKGSSAVCWSWPIHRRHQGGWHSVISARRAASKYAYAMRSAAPTRASHLAGGALGVPAWRTSGKSFQQDD
jgi:hypothetical protein